MTESNSMGYQDESSVRSLQPQRPETFNPVQPRFTPEELQVIKQCNVNSFYERSLPIGTALGLGTYFAVQKGYLKPNPRFGVYPKVTLAVIVGYFVGKLSYQQACAEKLMALPNSYIGQILRDRRDGKITGMAKKSTPMLNVGPNDIYSDAGPGSALDLDTDRPSFSDDSYRPNNEDRIIQPETGPARPSLSYEDLRRKNRGDYSESRQDPYRVDPPGTPPPVTRASPPRPATTPTNKYGDVME